MIAFTVPTSAGEMAELRYFTYRTHSECIPTHYITAADGRQIPRGMRPEICVGCIDERRDHDHGDEHDGMCCSACIIGFGSWAGAHIRSDRCNFR